MALGFVTTRIVLEKLGVSDYGLNNLVSGFVSMFTALNSILQGGTRRFLALNLVKNDSELQKRTFSTALIIHIGIAIIIFVALETLGVWFLNSRLNIDANRLIAANWVFQLSVLTTMLGVTQTPYTAAVTAHEKFDIYAYMSIYDVIAKILILFLLVYIPGDKLIVYAILLAIVSATNLLIYRFYCITKFKECQFSLYCDKTIFKEISQYSSWMLIGHICAVINGQGLSVLLNIFFNTVVNAARGLAATVTFTVQQFVGGFTQAAEPQLIKYYGEGDLKRFYSLIFNITQITLFLLAFFAVPIFMEIDYVLIFWLGEVPQYTTAFIKVTIITCFISYSGTMLDRGVVALGRSKELALYCNSWHIVLLPLVYFALKVGWQPTSVYFISMIPGLLSLGGYLYILNKYVDFPAKDYFFGIFVKNLFFVFVACVPPYLLQTQMEQGFLRFLIVCTVSVLSTIFVLYFFCMNSETRVIIKNKLFKR